MIVVLLTFARVLLNRLNERREQSGLLPESQFGFRKDRGTIDMIFTARQLQEKCQEQNVDLYMTFVDLTKAFDTVSLEGLWMDGYFIYRRSTLKGHIASNKLYII